MTGSRKWPTTAWRQLLELTFPALNALPSALAWTLGGGTALALKLNHRVSYDIDIFFENSSALRLLSPNHNPDVRRITDRWQEPGHYIKLECDEGAIDFIVAFTQTDVQPWVYKFKGRPILVEEPAEILAKKLKFRGSQFVPRDIFDLMAVARADPKAVEVAIAAAPNEARRAVDRIRRIAARYRETIADEVNPTPTGLELLDLDPSTAADLLEGSDRGSRALTGG